MSCEYFQEGRCYLAEGLAQLHLSETVQCVPLKADCARCLQAGPPDPATPSAACLSLVNPPMVKLHLWREAVSGFGFTYRQRERKVYPITGNGGTTYSSPPPTNQPPASPRTACQHRGEIIEQFVCRCNGVTKKPLYACAIYGQCVMLKAQSSYLSEHLRKKYPNPDQKSNRRFGICQGCSDFSSPDPIDDQALLPP